MTLTTPGARLLISEIPEPSLSDTLGDWQYKYESIPIT